jgi:hypothetical protein
MFEAVAAFLVILSVGILVAQRCTPFDCGNNSQSTVAGAGAALAAGCAQ